jgi:hypothetical protein
LEERLLCETSQLLINIGAPGWIRTSGLSLRRRTLYPTELREPEKGKSKK